MISPNPNAIVAFAKRNCCRCKQDFMTYHTQGRYMRCPSCKKGDIDRKLRGENELLGKPLAAREKQFVKCLKRGLSNKLIAHELGITYGSTKVAFNRIFKKLGVTNRVELALDLFPQTVDRA